METTDERTHYETLGVERTAAPEEIKRAYRGLMRKYHPDIFSGDREEGERIASEIGYAYSILSSDTARKEYDDLLDHGPAEPEPQEEVRPEDFEDSWGAEDEWVPEDDVEEDLADDSEVDADIVEDEPGAPAGQPTPPPSAATRGSRQEWLPEDLPETALITPLTGLLIPSLVGAAGVLIGTVWSLVAVVPAFVTAASPLVLALMALVVGIIGGALTATVRKKDSPAREPVKRPLLVIALATALVVIAAYFLGGNTMPAALAVVAACALVTSHVLARALARKRTLDRVIPGKTLLKSNLFGSLPGGAAADLLDTSLMDLCALPSVRILRNPDESALFSHTVVAGNRVALVKAILSTNGLYRWSGPSLLRDTLYQGNIFPEEVVRANYAEYLAAPHPGVPPNVQIDAWLVIYTQDGNHVVAIPRPSGDYPQVASPTSAVSEIGRFLVDDEDYNAVSQENVYGSLFLQQ